MPEGEKRAHEPERTCTGCGAKKPPRTMLRIASQSGGAPVVDEKYSAPGRGAYLCRDRACWLRAQKRRALERALKLRERVPRAVQDEIETLLSGSDGQDGRDATRESMSDKRK